MRLNFWIFILFLILSSFIGQSCREKPDVTRNPNYLDGIEDWAIFEIGTTWVYEEINLGRLDTNVVTSIFESFFDGDNEPITYIKNCWFKSSYYNKPRGFSIIEEIPIVTLMDSGKIGKNTPSLVLPIELGNSIETAASEVTIKEIIPNYHIIGLDTTLSEVVKVSVFKDIIANSDTSFYYWSKGIGIIRKEFPERNEVWDLTYFDVK